VGLAVGGGAANVTQMPTIWATAEGSSKTLSTANNIVIVALTGSIISNPTLELVTKKSMQRFGMNWQKYS
jgi:formyltetrahydrofolate synthetase